MYHEIILLGILISLIYTELTGISPAGLIVPSYLVLCLQNPYRVLYTAAIVFLTTVTVKVLSRYVILYGRRQFAVMIMAAVLINMLISFSGILPQNPGIIGTLIPGIIANECVRQGTVKSVTSLVLVTGILALILMWNRIGVFPI